MNYKVLFFAIGLSLFLMGMVLFFVVSAGARQASDEIIAQQQDRSLSNPAITKAVFEIGLPGYANEPHACKVPFSEHAYINLVTTYQQVPSSCSAFVNQRHAGTHRDLRPDCIGQCPYEEFSRTLPLGELDVRDTHVVRICCGDICLEQVLAPLCSPSDS